ncbi:uncharacterized protein si:ch211-110p13.9 [Brienomyrus brachyistius]|uniref:uncharacterized protein si:ch211-110p13.9 n=1 Tax=Brienomyrus brachyistius TaxID=42636 RepID=UPI0020B30030|nr:uncharacterized protein si:ch211-110p13.9 [Brienomyrus brachyistius]
MAEPHLISTIFLPHWRSGDRGIRFLYLADCCSFRISQSCDTKDSMLPLFLGADLFAKTNIRTENHPRYHAKFAKKGLATKLAFSSGFRLHGLRLPTGNNSLWFYSIQGVFRVAFELYSQHEQLSVLEAFQELWKSRMNDGPLNMCYCLSVQLDPPSPEVVVKIHDRELQLRLSCSNAPEIDVHSPQLLEGGSTAHQEEERPPTVTSASDHDYCRHARVISPDWYHSTSQKIQSLLVIMEDLMGEVEKEKQETVSLLLEHMEQSMKGRLDERGLSDLVLRLLESQEQRAMVPGSIYCSPLLCTVAGWLGHRFHTANSCISQQVESFKMQHIDHITDLPAAEQLAAELFPEAMRVLLLNWMGLSDSSAVWKRHSEYPILLLILEFANHNLITGVAHVLYSSLICK